jgi:hypothetical protein
LSFLRVPNLLSSGESKVEGRGGGNRMVMG